MFLDHAFPHPNACFNKVLRARGRPPEFRHAPIRNGFRRARFQTPSAVSFFFCPHRVPGRELSELLSAYYLCAIANSPSFRQSSPSLPQKLSEFSLPKQHSRNSTPPVSLEPTNLVYGDHPNSRKNAPRMKGQMKIFRVGSRQFRESLRELLRELWVSY